MVAAIGAAYLHPSLGLRGGPLKPEVVVDKVAVMLIFLLSGLSLQASELKAAAANTKLNGLIQGVNLGLIPLLAWAAAPALRTVLDSALVDGLVATMCLPTSINMCVVLTQAAGGAVSSSLFNAALGNILGVFLTPLLLFQALGCAAIALPYGAVLAKLGWKVLLPVAVGQLLRAQVPSLRDFRAQHTVAFGKASEACLLAIIYATFCEAFAKGLGASWSVVAGLLVGMPLLHVGLFGGTLALARLPRLGLRRPQQVAAAFTASHKTLAFGVPLLATVFAGHPQLALLTAPLLVLHPMQLAVGGGLVPRLKQYTDEYPPYASHVPLPQAMRSAADRNPSAYSDRTWAVLTQAKRQAAQKTDSGKSSHCNDAAATSAESGKAADARRFVRNIKIRTALIMAVMFLLNRRDAARVVGL